jgi:hypothetical protein
MWSALFGSGTALPTLILKPDPGATASVNGFKSGNELRIVADTSSQTLGDLLEKLNKYRGPDQQIRRVWDVSGNELFSNTIVSQTMTVIVRKSSIA